MLYKIQIGEQSFANLKYPKIYPLVLDINGDNCSFYYLTTEKHVFTNTKLLPLATFALLAVTVSSKTSSKRRLHIGPKQSSEFTMEK